MNLVLDIGNTSTKAAIFDNDKIVGTKIFDEPLVCDIEFLLRNYPSTNNCILSVVGKIDNSLYQYLNNTFPRIIELKGSTPLPFSNNYKSKETQGPDRIAAIAGVTVVFPGVDVLVIDAGTAIKFDFVDSSANYHGGNISPGIEMRFKALHTFTEKLPLLKKSITEKLLGDTTEDAIICGVLNAIVFEIEGYINALKKDYPNLKTIITGGDAGFLDDKIKSPIFADQNLVLTGLNRILQYNLRS
jgi:type III pantothenate kinase